MRHPLSLLLLAALLMTTASTLLAAPADLVLILDASGSMWGQVAGENKIVIARRVLGELVDGLPDDENVALVAYGHRRDGDCKDIETVAPLAPLDRPALKTTLEALNPKGRTPITASVEHAFELLEGHEEGATVILLSDGLETCGGDPCATVRAAREKGLKFVLHVIGFDVAKEDVSQFECTAQAGGGLFLPAANAGELSAALESAVALPAEGPAGRMVLGAVANGERIDVSIQVNLLAEGKEPEAFTSARTYTAPETNPRSIPLPDGRFEAKIQALGVEGNAERRLEFAIVDGSTFQETLDFSSGELSIGATRNGELSDVLYHIYPVGSRKEVASGRTYGDAKSNPAKVKLTAGTYEVEIDSIEIQGRPKVPLGQVEVKPSETVELHHAFESGALRIGVKRGWELVDAVITVRDAQGERARSRTYKGTQTNPSSFIVPPGEYQIEVAEIKGQKKEITVTVAAGAIEERTIDFSEP